MFPGNEFGFRTIDDALGRALIVITSGIRGVFSSVATFYAKLKSLISLQLSKKVSMEGTRRKRKARLTGMFFSCD